MKEYVFFDRNLYLELLSKHLHNLTEGYRQNLAFIGDELVGKTSIVLHFFNRYIDSRILPVYVEVKKEEFKFFIERFIGSMLYNFMKPSGIELKEDLDYLINKSEKFIPQTVRKIRDIRLLKKKESIFLELLSLCEILYKETKKFTVVIFDEFHNLETIGLKNIYRDWAKVLVLQKNTMFILISSSRFKAKRILSNNLNLLFGKFDLIEVEPLDYKKSREFLLDRLNGLALENRLLDFLISLCAGIPFYLKIISDSIYRIKERISLDTYINKNLILDVLTELLFEENGILYQHFCNYLNRIYQNSSKPETINILHAISCGYNRIKELNQVMHLQKKNILKFIQQLLQMDIITKNGDFFKINDYLFKIWLRTVHQKKTSGMDFNLQSQRQLFRKEMEKIFNEFINDSNKSLLERIIDIMHLFENACIDIDNKRLRLTSFREIKPLPFENPSIKQGLIARSTDYLWIVAIKDDILNEKDIEDFSRFCNKYKDKKQRRIIVTSHHIDTNVRLKALEERILTWEIKNISYSIAQLSYVELFI